MSIHGIAADGISVGLDLEVGHLAVLEVDSDGRRLSPLHKAPWVGDPEQDFPPGTAPNVRHLSGDFFCAPFGRSDADCGDPGPAPSHGWPANSAWTVLRSGPTPSGAEAVFRLDRRVCGATVEKTLRLLHGHPFVYQQHRFIGGEGAISAAHHTMVHMREGGDIAVSPKLFAETPADPLEPDPSRGRFVLAYPATTPDLHAFPLADGGTADLGRYPPGDRHEDFLTLAEAPGRPLGWTIVSRRAERDRVLVLKNPAVLPVTMLWMSNGGRDYAPWSSRHAGVLGIEDARASPLGHADSIRPNAWTARGIATAFDLADGGAIVISQVIGACAMGEGEGAVRAVSVEGDKVIVSCAGGLSRRLPFDPEFLAGQAASKLG
ncbi:hypothetical protein DFR52_102391 [Hoeflea marina]|uniref:Galactose mutarotase-like enzyme n=1 Tax=Hoeflea marina TaxID=274592 RepID=A0A317PLV3_9HYPH|nr:hypothetical protein [Hoeflea marina]PWW01727.1 hypothetical protein DFR52_102391 [Hoeflea marina]